MNSHSVLILAVVGLVGCASDRDGVPGDGSGGEVRALTCEVITGQNCWKEVVAEVAQCAPPESPQGLLDEAGQHCEYDDGTLVDLTGTSISDDSFDQEINFEMSVNGELCASVFMPEMGDAWLWEVTTKSGTTSYGSNESGDTIHMTCPDGVTYSAGFFEVLGCEDVGNHLPGWSGALGEDWASFSFFTPSSPDAESAILVPVFSCADDSLLGL